jgi:hypothetical protein
MIAMNGEGGIDRARLLDLSGRSRKDQYGLARSYRLTAFGCPAGGCLLTDPIFAKRLGDLFRHNPGCTMDDATLLKTGRHFRLSPSIKLIVGRNKAENDRLQASARENDLFLMPVSFRGPSALIIGPADEEAISVSANIMASYAKDCAFPVTVASGRDRSCRHHVAAHLPVDIDRLRIA